MKIDEIKYKLLQEYSESKIELISKIGYLECNISELEREKSNLIEEYLKTSDKVQEILNELETQYGKGRIIMETGEWKAFY